MSPSIPHQQNALILETKGGPFVLGTRPVPTAGPGDLLVKIHAAGLNPVDWKIQAWKVFIEEFPAVVGQDIAGEVVAVGDGVDGWRTGDRVYFHGPYNDGRYGGFQEYTLVAAEIAAKIPANLSYSEAATIPVACHTAAYGLFAPLPIGAGLTAPFDGTAAYTGQPVLVIGGSASCGQYGIQFLRLAGFSPIITYASARHAAYLKSLGATHVLDRALIPLDAAALRAAIHAIAPIEGGGLPLVYDAVCTAEAQNAGYAQLRAGGTLVTLLASAVEAPVPGTRVLHVLGGVHIGPEHRAWGLRLATALPPLFADGRLVPNRVETLPHGLAGIRDGLARMQHEGVSGVKLVGLPMDA
ncbi:chaperonin 10-like protein [Mycena belliarum]|uniref:Chaperonin 10-like protein n=1 Tax=Mycena belliarum TaxID=1033014 RepID=A0AAD6TX68_9AGAR|nr:chaperonin 10-like protein [Mycena belliae]